MWRANLYNWEILSKVIFIQLCCLYWQSANIAVVPYLRLLVIFCWGRLFTHAQNAKTLTIDIPCSYAKILGGNKILTSGVSPKWVKIRCRKKKKKKKSQLKQWPASHPWKPPGPKKVKTHTKVKCVCKVSTHQCVFVIFRTNFNTNNWFNEWNYNIIRKFPTGQGLVQKCSFHLYEILISQIIIYIYKIVFHFIYNLNKKFPFVTISIQE